MRILIGLIGLLIVCLIIDTCERYSYQKDFKFNIQDLQNKFADSSMAFVPGELKNGKTIIIGIDKDNNKFIFKDANEVLRKSNFLAVKPDELNTLVVVFTNEKYCGSYNSFQGKKLEGYCQYGDICFIDVKSRTIKKKVVISSSQPSKTYSKKFSNREVVGVLSQTEIASIVMQELNK